MQPFAFLYEEIQHRRAGYTGNRQEEPLPTLHHAEGRAPVFHVTHVQHPVPYLILAIGPKPRLRPVLAELIAYKYNGRHYGGYRHKNRRPAGGDQ